MKNTCSKWRSGLAVIGPGWDVAGGGTVSSHADRARVILKGANFATMFAYLWRRFGPPPRGWDNHKELVNYWITTPVKGIAFGLACSPSFESCGAGVSYAIDKHWSNRVRKWESGKADEWMRGFRRHLMTDERYVPQAIISYVEGPDMWDVKERCSPPMISQSVRLYRDYLLRVGPEPEIRHFEEWPDIPWGGDRPTVPVDQLENAPHRVILKAIEDGLRDLLRPVPIRDIYINACGRVPDDSKFLRRTVTPSKRAGYGCSPDFIDAGETWIQLADEIRAKGVSASLKILASARSGHAPRTTPRNELRGAGVSKT